MTSRHGFELHPPASYLPTILPLGERGGGGKRYGRSGEGGAGGKRRKCVSLFVFVLPVYGLPMCQLINYQSCGQHNSGKGPGESMYLAEIF